MFGRRVALCGLCYAWMLGGQTLAEARAPAPNILAVEPYLPAAELQRRFRPLAAYMGRALGREFVVRIGQDYSEHVNAIGGDRVDVAFLGPVEYVKVTRNYGPKPLLARFEVNHQSQLHGVIFVRRGSMLHTLADLKGKRFAFGDRDSTMAHVVPEWVLIRAGVPVSALSGYQFLASHQDVALAVLAGDYDAGAVKQEVFDQYQGRGLELLATLPATPDYVFVARANLATADVERLRAALLGVKDGPRGAEVLAGLHSGLTALIPAKDADYDPVRRILREVSSSSRP